MHTVWVGMAWQGMRVTTTAQHRSVRLKTVSLRMVWRGHMRSQARARPHKAKAHRVQSETRREVQCSR
jgi:hypothetical protein